MIIGTFAESAKPMAEPRIAVGLALPRYCLSSIADHDDSMTIAACSNDFILSISFSKRALSCVQHIIKSARLLRSTVIRLSKPSML